MNKPNRRPIFLEFPNRICQLKLNWSNNVCVLYILHKIAGMELETFLIPQLDFKGSMIDHLRYTRGMKEVDLCIKNNFVMVTFANELKDVRY